VFVQRREYPSQIRRKEKGAAVYKRWKVRMNKLVWGAMAAREKGY
jgi:hypothetical protein